MSPDLLARFDAMLDGSAFADPGTVSLLREVRVALAATANVRTAAQALLDTVDMYGECPFCSAIDDDHQTTCVGEALLAALAAEATEPPPRLNAGELMTVTALLERVEAWVASVEGTPAPWALVGDVADFLRRLTSGPAPDPQGAAPDEPTTLGPCQEDVDQLRELLDLMASFPSNDQRARYLLSSNWLRDRGAVAASAIRMKTAGAPDEPTTLHGLVTDTEDFDSEHGDHTLLSIAVAGLGHDELLDHHVAIVDEGDVMNHPDWGRDPSESVDDLRKGAPSA